MLLKPDCIPCILKMIISSLRKLALEERSVKELYCRILENPALRGLNWDITSPEVIEDGWRKIVKSFDGLAKNRFQTTLAYVQDQAEENYL